MKKQLMKWHNFLTWIAFIGVFCWALSGISHPVMAWLGPQAKTMMPPMFKATPETLYQVEDIVDQLPIEHAAIVKVVASNQGNLLQITENDQEPRRYFNLENGTELIDHDVEQAKWLASHYLDLPQENITNIEFRDTFGAGYPRVNRLLPVYKVSFTTQNDVMTAFVYTETGALASVNNNFKAATQSFFRVLHTWSWLDVTGFGRVFIVALFMLTLFAMASTGFYLVFALPNRKIPKTSRRWHRRFAYVLFLPLLGWSASGFYHLLQAEYVQPVSGIRLLEPIHLNNFSVEDEQQTQWQESVKNNIPQDAYLNAISLNQSIDGKPLYRLGISAPIEKEMSAHEQRKSRFYGQPVEKSSAYINAQTGHTEGTNDKELAKALASSFKNLAGAEEESDISEMRLITHFGPNYDFRNKRLPVWQIDFNDDNGSRVFVDPATGILVDQNRRVDRLESLSFSMLHKWNFLRPLIGPKKRDILIVITLLALMLISCFGLIMYLSRKKRKTKN